MMQTLTELKREIDSSTVILGGFNIIKDKYCMILNFNNG